MPPSVLPSTAFVYTGPGAGSRSVLSAVESLRRALKPTLLVDTLTTDQLLQGEWTNRCRMLVMPGGADVPYCKHLNGRGNILISHFVRKQGGTYLGLCAGAYYGCSRVEFELGSEIEVLGDRELAFYPGIASGSIYSGFNYQSEKGAIAAPIKFKSRISVGPGSSSSSTDNSVVWEECKDYLNGGPGFLEVSLDTINSNGNGGALRGSYLTKESSYIPENIEILATFTDHNDAAAAIACHVGLGRAVLCSTHPELAPDWLALPSGAGRSDAVLSSVDLEKKTYTNSSGGNSMTVSVSNSVKTENDDGHVDMLRSELVVHESGRWKFWRTLLIAAGLEDALIDS